MKSSYFFSDLEFTPEVLVGAVVLYLALMAYTRLFGLKSFSKMSSIDFANTIAIGSLLATTLATGKPSIALGILILGLLFFLKFLNSRLRFGSKRLEDVIDNQPLLLMYRGQILREHLRRSRVTEAELRGKLREANVFALAEVEAVVLETTGDVSVLHSAEGKPLESYLLEDVVKSE